MLPKDAGGTAHPRNLQDGGMETRTMALTWFMVSRRLQVCVERVTAGVDPTQRPTHPPSQAARDGEWSELLFHVPLECFWAV